MKSKQSLAGFIREHLEAIEARLENGIRQDVIVEELAEKGYQTTLQSLRNLIYRARKRRATRPASSTPPYHALTQTASIVSSKKTKQSGFEYGGTKDIDESDLI